MKVHDKRKIRFAAFAAALSLLSSTGCSLFVNNDISDMLFGNSRETEEIIETSPPETTTPFTPYTPEEDYAALGRSYLKSLPSLTFNSTSFFITTPDRSYISPDVLTTTMSQKAYERNQELEELYDITLFTSIANADTIYEECKAANSSGTYYTDFMMLPLYMLGSFRAAGILENLRSLPYLDMSAPYFYAESAEMCSAGYDTWGIAGHASTSPADFSAVYFNKELVAEMQMETPYAKVLDGSWTWDEYFAYTAALQQYNDLNGTSYYSSTTQYAAGRLPDLIYVSLGNSFVQSGEMLIPVIDFTEETVAGALDVSNRIFKDPLAITSDTANASAVFSEGRSLFFIDHVYVADWLANAEANWGVLPLPKASAEDDYRTLVSNTSLVFTVPAGTVNNEMVSVILSAINALSYHQLYDEYVNHAMIYTLRDNSSVNMLDIIFDTPAFDFSLSVGNAYPNIARGTYALIRDVFKAGEIPDKFEDTVSNANMILAEHFPLG
ncbi:MAG: hypothetical protein IJ325_02995 [Clostridia bacterium]|nr:hypothetical protein [Clostridia bacterium]